MISSINSGLSYAQHGQRVPSDSMTMYVQADSMVRTTADDFKSADVVKAAKDDSVAMKAQVEKQFASAFKAVPATAEQAKAVTLNVLMCGTFAGALDTALYNTLKEAPIIDTPAGPDAELHGQMREILQGAAEIATTAKEQLGGNAKQGVNIMRSMLSEEADAAVQLAGKDDEAARKQYAQHLLHLFQGGYMVGAGSAVLNGKSL